MLDSQRLRCRRSYHCTLISATAPAISATIPVLRGQRHIQLSTTPRDHTHTSPPSPTPQPGESQHHRPKARSTRVAPHQKTLPGTAPALPNPSSLLSDTTIDQTPSVSLSTDNRCPPQRQSHHVRIMQKTGEGIRAEGKRLIDSVQSRGVFLCA